MSFFKKLIERVFGPPPAAPEATEPARSETKPKAQKRARRTPRAPAHREPAARGPWTPDRLLGNGERPERVRVLLDTCFLMEPSGARFVQEVLAPWAEEVKGRHGVAILGLPTHAWSELERLSKTPPGPNHNPHRQEQAKRAAALTYELVKKRGVLELLNNKMAAEEQRADNVFPATITLQLLKHDILLLTQDRKLAETCTANWWTVFDSDAIVGHKRRFRAARVRRDGRLEAFHPVPWEERGRGRGGPPRATPRAQAGGPAPRAQAGSAPPRLRKLTKKLVAADPMPGLGDAVLISEQRHRLEGPELSGGEGKVYLLAERADQVAKIYHPSQLHSWRVEKLRRMVERSPNNRGICWPIDLVRNEKKQVVGFTMRRVENAAPLMDIAFSVGQLQASYPHWKRRHLVELAGKLCSVMSIIHERNGVIGDLNPANILVTEDNGKPFIQVVDVDSWQFEGWPSPVGMKDYSHPDLHGRVFSEVLRTRQHDEYALAILVFQILFVGRHPYAARGEKSLAEAMADRDFGYPFGGREPQTRVRRGFAWKVWTHLPWAVQRLCHRAFAEGDVVTAAEWARELREYQTAIEKDALDVLGNADEIRPAEVIVPKDREDGVTEDFRCADCGTSTTFYGKKAIERNRGLRRFRCEACRVRGEMENRQGDSRICETCHHVFTHPIWFERMMAEAKQGIPSRCPEHGGPRSRFSCANNHERREFTPRSIAQWRAVSGSARPLCGGCAKKEQLQRQAELEANGERFQCAECGESFVAPPSVAAHLKTRPPSTVRCRKHMQRG